MYLGLEKCKPPSRGRGTGLMQPAMTVARRQLVRGRGTGIRMKGDQPVGVQELVKGNPIEIKTF